MTEVKEISIKRPGYLLRTLFRVPLVLYRLGLGDLMSMQILLTTVGRRTGRHYKVVVDIIEHDKTKDTYYVSAAFGPQSDWYLNLKANPIVQAQVGRRKFIVRTTTLPFNEAEDILVKFTCRHQHYVNFMMHVIGVRISWSKENMHTLALKIPVIACMRIPANSNPQHALS
jgi:deazaflavin-dependent oxidoreductase (nitroreductase family)